MKKKILSFLMLSLLLLIPLNLIAQEESEGKKLRLFMNTGEIIDFNAADVDSITSTSQSQLIWQDETSRSFSTDDIDSIVYITPFLKLSMCEMNFGKVAVGHNKSITFTITSTSPYRETFFLFAEGVFYTQDSGKYFTINPGESKDMDILFKPTEKKYYSSKLLLSSSAAEDGLLSLPLVGRGVDSELEEENHILPPEDMAMGIALADDQSAEELMGFKIVNSYGEFPIEMSAGVKSMRREYSNGNYIGSPIQKSPNGLQMHTMVDIWNNPWLFSISLPDQDKPEMSPEETAISILMTDPLLITSNEAAFNNTVQAIKSLGTVYDEFVAQVTNIWAEGWRDKKCPDYSSVNIGPIIMALYEKVKDNSNLTLDGLSLKNIAREPDTIRYKVQNDLRRLVHIYPRRAKKAADSMVGYERMDDMTNSLKEVCEFILDESGELKDELKDEEYKAYVEDLQEWIGEVESALVKLGIADEDSHIQVPIILDSKNANYWRLIKETTWDHWLKNYDLSRSIHEVITSEIATPIDDCDQVQVDIYGMGMLDKKWSEYTGTQKFRMIYAFMHSAYKDFIKPLMDISAGIKDVDKATDYDNNKYDFRYGARKLPELALIKKLAHDFCTGYFGEKKNLDAIKESIDKRDFWAIILQTSSFACDCILKNPADDPNDDKRTYTNLIYNIYKKWSKNPATSKEFRNNFKTVANNLTHLRNAHFASKVINTLESGVDLAESAHAFLITNALNTFNINKSITPYITVIEPKGPIQVSSNNVHFAWKTYKADYFDHFLYNLDLFIITPERAFEVTAKKDIDATEYNLNLASVLSSNGASNAISVEFRLSGHADNNPDIVYCVTKYLPLMKLISPDDFIFVDIGLPSGVLWSNRNLGASTARDFGNYYAWGERKGFDEGKNSFSWKTYQYCKGTPNSLTKYCTKSHYGNSGFTDGMTQLQGTDDPASSIYGYYYAIPTKEEWEELMTLCRWSRLDGCAFVRGVEGKSDNVILIPPAGYRSGINLYDSEKEGFYWTSTLDASSPDDAWMMHFSTSNAKPNDYDYYRCQGRSVRMVLRPIDDQINNGSKQRNNKRNASSYVGETLNTEGLSVKMETRSSVNK